MTGDRSQFMAKGAERFRTNAEFQARLQILRESIHAEYAPRLATAGFFRRYALRWRAWAEYRRQRRRLYPSSKSLYAGNNRHA